MNMHYSSIKDLLLRMRSSKSCKMQAVFFSPYLVHKRALWFQAFLAETMETEDKWSLYANKTLDEHVDD